MSFAYTSWKEDTVLFALVSVSASSICGWGGGARGWRRGSLRRFVCGCCSFGFSIKLVNTTLWKLFSPITHNSSLLSALTLPVCVCFVAYFLRIHRFPFEKKPLVVRVCGGIRTKNVRGQSLHPRPASYTGPSVFTAALGRYRCSACRHHGPQSTSSVDSSAVGTFGRQFRLL